LQAKSALGDSYDWDGQLLKSLSLRKKVHKARLELLGVDHPDTLHAFNRLVDTRSLLAHTQEEKEEVCRLREEAVASWRRVRGEVHPQTNEARVNLGHSYTAASRFEEALLEQQDVLAIRNEKDPGEESQETLDNKKGLASVLSAVNAAPQAAVLMEEVLRVETRHLGRDHPRTRETGALLHRYYQEAG
ncbi:uncharacterized protein BDZ83DRAFT_538820, partial [Colletotrichum acutatum]